MKRLMWETFELYQQIYGIYIAHFRSVATFNSLYDYNYSESKY